MRSIRTNPPTVRKLRNSTPKNHASTNQRRASGRGDAGICAPAAPKGANALTRCESETADAEAAPIHEADVPAALFHAALSQSTKNVTTGAATISSSVTTAAT